MAEVRLARAGRSVPLTPLSLQRPRPRRLVGSWQNTKFLALAENLHPPSSVLLFCAMSSNHVCEYTSRDPTAEDGLFLERLETFMDKCLADIRAFSERELRPFEQVPSGSLIHDSRHSNFPSMSAFRSDTAICR